MSISDQEIFEIKKFIFQLNSLEEGSIVVVEGKRDSNALSRLGYSGKILEFNKFRGMVDFTDHVARYKKLIVLFDRDKKGTELTAKTMHLLQRRTKVDLSYKKSLQEITSGKIKFIEQMKCYESRIAKDYGQMPF